MTAMIITIAIMAIIGLILISVCMVNSARIEELNCRIDDLARRVESVAQAGMMLNNDLRVTQQQINDAKKRAKL